MQIDQILIRPRDQKILAQHTNSIGRSAGTAIAYSDLNQSQTTALSALVSWIESKLPQDPPMAVTQAIA